MINRTTVLVTEETNPYRNLAVEEQLLEGLQEGECILYLWQNKNTVVIGKNQNAFRECKTEELKEAGGLLARRFSGGGAVYHDLGNLNFTFLVGKQDYEETKQLDVIIRALKQFGIPAEKNGRNDLVSEGRKFSGNAFYHRGNASCHHGTLLYDVDMEKMQRFLNVSEKKLQSKGVTSVRSRVVNLKELCPELTIPALQEALVKAFGEIYQGNVEILEKNRIDWERVEKQEKFLSSWEWLYGRKIPFQREVSEKFSWGEIQIQTAVEEGRIKEIEIYTDAMETGFIRPLKECFRGLPYGEDSMRKAMERLCEAEREELISLSVREDLTMLWSRDF